jgi:hypothetical protein
MQKPNVDDSLTLLTGAGKTGAIVIDVLDNPAREEGVLLKVMTRGSFEQGQQVWIVDRDGSKVGATVENVVQQTVDSEVTLSTVLTGEVEPGARTAPAPESPTPATGRCFAVKSRPSRSTHLSRYLGACFRHSFLL